MRKFTLIIISILILAACGRDEAPIPEDEGTPVIERTIEALSDNTVETDAVVKVEVPEPEPEPVLLVVSENTVSENEAEEELAEEEEEEEEEEPPFVDGSEMVRNIIVDTDYASDVDDVACIRVACSMARLGLINFCAAGTSSLGDYATRGLHGHLCCEGFAYVPTGYNPQGIECPSPFLQYFVQNYHDAGTYTVIDAVELYKNVIAENAKKGEKTRIVTTGYLSNIERLLLDPVGMQLVKNNVDSIWVTGGGYPEPGRDFNFWWKEEATRAAQTCVMYSPVPLVFITGNTGHSSVTGQYISGGINLWKLDPKSKDVVSRAYRCFEEAHEGSDLKGGYNAQDSIAVWAASSSFEQSNMHITRIDATILDDGTNIFLPNPNGRHAVLERNDENIYWYILQINKYIDYPLTGVLY
ncbi:MAG: hypothetical protein K6B44_11310 [Lachnospiraceae bacterium]|nr:hypothetical protein [Lachnospiraceae bacterium]